MRLRVASEAEKLERDRACYEAWGPPLTPEAWVERERRLRAHRWPQQSMTTWLWVDESGRVLSSCETFRVPSIHQGKPGGSYGVASVYTEPALRGRGHATAMLSSLTGELTRRELHPHAAFLFSDVGAAIYQRAGYQERPAFDWVIPAAPSPREAGVKWLGEGELEDALARLRPPTDPFLIWPTGPQLDWHLERERIYAEALQRPRPRHAGVRIGESTAIWAGAPKSNELAVLLIDARGQQEAERLLQAAAGAAHLAGLARVRVWETPQLPSLAGVGVRAAREGSLPMLAPLEPSVSAAGWRTIPRALWL